mgnify:CR=1 FL=1
MANSVPIIYVKLNEKIMSGDPNAAAGWKCFFVHPFLL